MRRSLDPEGYEDPGLKSSQLSLGEMSGEWRLGGTAWGTSAGVTLLHRGWHCMGQQCWAGIAWAPALHRVTLHGHLCCKGVLLHGQQCCTGVTLHGQCKG